ncbi:hypothetical protein Acr_08g0016910 [Actinidia rufa]|uniref:DUF659 domain-containing protein n=1 Tax=Actinidia rufa TaxID=165716 RepID=A0A7J0F3M4_9ERIC|nr:hypothetical protein Acr_08g0016910 [Actinidia rufa]
MVTDINRAPKGYKAPSFEKSRTTLLDEVKTSIEKELIHVKDTWYTDGVSIVSAGWSNVKKNPLINVLAVNSRGAMFLYAEDYSGVEKSGINIAKLLLQAIDEVGPSNVVQVLTDNAANCKVAGKEIEKIETIILGRWEKMNVPMHCLGFALSPRFYDSAYIASDPEEAKMLHKQFVDFHMRKGLYSTTSAFVDATTMGAIEWWATYGSETPELAEVARKFFIHSNIRLLSRFQENYKEGPFKKWDVDPEDTIMEDSQVRLEEMRWNSLDDDNDETQQEQQPQASGKIKDQHTTHGSRVHGQSSTPLVISSNPVPRMRSQQSQISNFVRRGAAGGVGPSSSKDKGKKIA